MLFVLFNFAFNEVIYPKWVPIINLCYFIRYKVWENINNNTVTNNFLFIYTF